jgi:16S rRNA (cytosine1402-N4)-methyltransferase
VNRELDELDALLAATPEVLAPGGRAAIISFHSLEDRKIKQAFSNEQMYLSVSRKPIIASEDEQTHNTRSRSAKLRVVARLGEGVTEVAETSGHERYLARKGGKRTKATKIEATE